MKKTTLFVLIYLFSLQTFSQSHRAMMNEINVLNETIDSLKKTVEQQESQFKQYFVELNKYKSETNQKIASQNQNLTLSTNSVSTSLSSMDNYLSLWGIIFTIFGVLIGAYIVWAQNRMSNILKDANNVLVQQKVIQKEVNNTQHLIENDLEGLYQKLERQEVNQMVKRLIINSEDLCNLFSPLASKNISAEHFSDLKTVALKCYEKGYPNRFEEISNISTLLFQHFPEKTFFDTELKQHIFPRLPHIINNHFPNEIESCTEKIIDFAVNRRINDFEEILVLYFNAIQDTDHAYNSKIYKIAYDHCLTKENRFLLFKPIEESGKAENFIAYWQQNMLEYEKDKNSIEQEAILNKIKNPTPPSKSS